MVSTLVQVEFFPHLPFMLSMLCFVCTENKQQYSLWSLKLS